MRIMEEKKNVRIEENKGLTFRDVLFIIKKHWIAIVAFIVCCTVGGFVWSLVEQPVYKSTGTMLVSYESSSSNVTQDYTFSNYISNTYVVFIKEDIVLEKVAGKLNSEYTLNQLKKGTSVSNSSLVISVSFSASDKDSAKKVVQTILDTAQEVADSVDNENKPVYHLLYDNLKVLSPAKDGTRVSHTLRDLGIGFAAGVGSAFVYVIIRELSDNTFKSSEEIERVLNLPVLAGIPDYHFEDEKKGGK